MAIMPVLSNRVAFRRPGGDVSELDFDGLDVADHVSAAMGIAFDRLDPTCRIGCTGHDRAVAGSLGSAPVEFP